MESLIQNLNSKEYIQFLKQLDILSKINSIDPYLVTKALGIGFVSLGLFYIGLVV